jgi:iron(III) transport system substrate-binding protein
MKRRQLLPVVAGLALLLGMPAAFGQAAPAGYPTDYATLIASAKKEGKVVIYTSTDAKQAQPLVEAFKQTYPGVEVEVNDLGTNGSYNRALSEAAAKQVGSDLVWTSAMDLQMVLVDKGLADSYRSPETKNLPAWGHYKDTLFGTSLEPSAILYNKKLFPAEWVPKSRAELIKVLKDRREQLKGKVTTFDPEKSGTGFFFATADLRQTTDFWDLVAAFGAAEGKVYGSSGAMREKIVSGEHVLAFNIIGSYALEWAKENPNLGVAFQNEYTSTFSRVANISKGAPHPNAARLFLDFMLSEKGQKALADKGVPSIRSDVGSLNAASLNKLVGGGLKPTPVDDQLTHYMDPKRRAEFFQQWKKSLGR